MMWEKVKLGDISRVSSSKRIFARQYDEKRIPFYRQKEIIDKKNKKSIIAPLFISVDTYNEIKKKFGVPVKGDLLITAVGVTLGIPYVVDDEKFYFKDGNLIWLSNFKENINSKYIYYWIISDIGQKAMWSRVIGSAQPALTIDTIKQFEVPVPTYSLQNKIVKILESYDDLIENNQKQIKLLEEAAQRLYKEWFVDLRFPGYETTPIIDGVPEGWSKSLVGECAIILRRGISPAYNENGKYKVINQKCIRQTVVDFAEARKQEKAYSDDLNLLDSDTVICSTGAGTLGRVGQIFGNYPKTTFDSHITLVRANEMIGKQYLFHVLKSYQSYLMGMGKGSTNQLELSRNTIQELTIYVPTFELKIQFEVLVQPIHDKIVLLNKEIKCLYEARDRLLPKLMSGELEV